MKKIFTLVLGFAIFQSTFATNNIKLKADTISLSSTVGVGSAAVGFKLYNISNSAQSVTWVKTTNCPSAWAVGICENTNCYPASVSTHTFTLFAGDSITLDVSVGFGNTAGTGTAKLAITTTSNDTLNGIAKINVGFNAGVNSLKQNDVKIFPTPFQSSFNIKSNTDLKAKYLEMYNVIGTLVYKQELSDDSYEFVINPTSIPIGVYFVTLLDNDRKTILSKRIQKN